MSLTKDKIRPNQISMLFQHQLSDQKVTKYLDISDEDKTYDALKELTESQYKYLNLLYINKEYKKLAHLLIENGIKVNPDYADYINNKYV